MNERPNVVLICVDQWRGDCLSIAGHPVVQTPYLDGLALSGARFNRAYTACPSCIAARASLYTGLTQRTHGRVGYQDGVAWNYPVTIASEFTRQGYQSQAVGKLHVYPERSQVGFQNVELHDGYLHYARDHHSDQSEVDDYIQWLRRETGRPDADYHETGLHCNTFVARPWDKEEYLHPTNWVTSRSIDFLRRRDPRKPYFLYMSYHRPHPPFDPPAWAFEQYMRLQMPDPPRGDWAKSLPWSTPSLHPDLSYGRLSEAAMQQARAGYYGHMTHIDHQINRFLETLYQNRKERTIVCFVSDHGELLGDHDHWRKTLPYEGSARVPLLLRGPNVPAGAVCDDVVELRDVMPTLLDCAGLEVPASVEGHSILPRLRGDKNVPWREYLHGEHAYYGQSVHYIVDGKRKYIWLSGTGQEQLFDLANDPTELHDIAAKATDDLNQMRGWLIKELTGREEGYVAGNKLVTGRPVKSVLSHLLK
ncbi:arylsulfatase [soil metagenome]